jgi:diguanylate cyclase (GGDEF)-like protein
LVNRSFPTFPELQTLGTEAPLAPGEVLWKEGDPGNYVVLLIDGSLEVTHETPEGEVVVLRNMYPGAVVGEMAALDGQSRSATVKARASCRILKIPSSKFRDFLRQRPDILEQLFWLQLERVRSLTWRVTRTHHRAITDPLTSLYNFGFFRDRLEIEVDRAHQTGDPVSLAIFDIDHFKRYNDTHGHHEGNKVLERVAEILKSVGRRGDVVARYGGEEFVALLYGAQKEEAWRFAESVRLAIEAHDFPGRQTQPGGRITVSGGVASMPNDAPDDLALIKAADANLYRAKEEGRNRVRPELGPAPPA